MSICILLYFCYIQLKTKLLFELLLNLPTKLYFHMIEEVFGFIFRYFFHKLKNVIKVYLIYQHYIK